MVSLPLGAGVLRLALLADRDSKSLPKTKLASCLWMILDRGFLGPCCRLDEVLRSSNLQLIGVRTLRSKVGWVF